MTTSSSAAGDSGWAGRFRLAQQAWFDQLAKAPPRILVIQRDNIGDLVLVTPFLQALRACVRDARIDVLVNSYNEAVLARNPDVDQCYRYVKAKHRNPGESLLSVYWQTARMWSHLRANHYNLAILMTGRASPTSLRPATIARVHHIAGFVDEGANPGPIDLAVAAASIRERHVVRRSEALLDAVVPPTLRQQFWPGELPPCRVFPDPALVESIRARRLETLGNYCRLVIGVHISARKVDQRLSVAKFVSLMHRLHSQTQCGFMLFWAPGGSANALHPGDDAKAEEILALTSALPVYPHETLCLSELVAGVGLPHLFVCSDGGAMHIAAAQHVPVVALFGNSDPQVWHPWGTRYEVLRAESAKVEDLSIEAIAEGVLRMLDIDPRPVGQKPV